MQAADPTGGSNRLEIEVNRQVPAFFMNHHAGTPAVEEKKSTCGKYPVTPLKSRPGTNEPTRVSKPVFASHANARFAAPPSPRQPSQRRATPGCRPKARPGRRRSSSKGRMRRMEEPPSLDGERVARGFRSTSV